MRFIGVLLVAAALSMLGITGASALPNPTKVTKTVAPGCPAGYHIVWTFKNNMAYYQCVANS